MYKQLSYQLDSSWPRRHEWKKLIAKWEIMQWNIVEHLKRNETSMCVRYCMDRSWKHDTEWKQSFTESYRILILRNAPDRQIHRHTKYVSDCLRGTSGGPGKHNHHCVAVWFLPGVLTMLSNWVLATVAEDCTWQLSRACLLWHVKSISIKL